MAKEMRKVYFQTVAELAEKDENVVVLEADLAGSMGTKALKDIIGERYIDTGIMEGEEMCAAGGLAITGFLPFIHTFAAFATRRAYDQLFLSLAYSGNHAVIIGSDPGITAEVNGGTHTAFEDLALMRAIPGAVVYEVCDPIQFKYILKTAYDGNGLYYIRTIRKNGSEIYKPEAIFEEGYTVLREGQDLTIFACGLEVEQALSAAQNLSKNGVEAEVIDLYRIKPLPEEVILRAAKKGPIVTAENHSVIGGMGDAVACFTAETSPVRIARVGVQDMFGRVGKADYLMQVYGLTAKDIEVAALKVLKDV